METGRKGRQGKDDSVRAGTQSGLK